MEQPISFTVGPDELFGVLHRPESSAGERPELAVLFVHSGSRGRLGCTFHYPHMARRLAALGYPVLRYDPPGLGDSTGSIETGPTDDFYGSVQSGRYLPDTLAAIEELRRRVMPRKIVLLGVCGGAITALGAAALAEGVAGAALLSIPVMLDFASQELAERIPTEYARKYLWSLYGRKLASAAAWWRLLTLRSDVPLMRTYLAAAFRRVRKGNGNGAPAGAGKQKLNPRFVDWLGALCRRQGRALFIFGDDDRFRWEFEREFFQTHWASSASYEEQCTVRRIPHCNHMLTMREWQDQALALVVPWLETLRPVGERGAAHATTAVHPAA
jgi:uncharacterized protein